MKCFLSVAALVVPATASSAQVPNRAASEVAIPVQSTNPAATAATPSQPAASDDRATEQQPEEKKACDQPNPNPSSSQTGAGYESDALAENKPPFIQAAYGGSEIAMNKHLKDHIHRSKCKPHES